MKSEVWTELGRTILDSHKWTEQEWDMSFEMSHVKCRNCYGFIFKYPRTLAASVQVDIVVGIGKIDLHQPYYVCSSGQHQYTSSEVEKLQVLPMANIGDFFGGNYLKSSDIEPLEGETFTIKSVETEQVGRNKENKLVIYFKEKQLEKGLVLNKTNAEVIAKQAGNDTDKWNGTTISFIVIQTEFNGELVDAIRIAEVNGTSTTGKKKVSPAGKKPAGSHAYKLDSLNDFIGKVSP